MRFLHAAVTIAIIIAVPLALIGSAVRIVFSYQPLYEYGFDRYRIADYTGISRAELSQVATAFVAYFNNNDREINLEVTQRGLRKLVFTDKEVSHMVDVKALVRLFYQIQIVAFVVLALGAAHLFWYFRGDWLVRLSRALRTGSFLTFGMLAALGLLSFADFDQLFLQFHYLSFPGNDDWLLDPRIHNLIAMFPEPFWLDGTIALAGVIALEAALVLVLAWRLSVAAETLRRMAPTR